MNTLFSVSTFMGVNLRGWGGDGYSVHGDGREWGSVSVPVHSDIKCRRTPNRNIADLLYGCHILLDVYF